MSCRISILIFLVILAAAGWFVFNTSGALPEQVASHFGRFGAADSFMSRSVYMTFMLIFVVGLPLVMTVLLTLVFRGATTSQNIPNRDYWLEPARRADTIAFLTRHRMRFGACLAVFLSFVHWLVVRANARQPAELSNSEIYAGALLFVLTIVVWTVWLLLAFRKPK